MSASFLSSNLYSAFFLVGNSHSSNHMNGLVCGSKTLCSLEPTLCSPLTLRLCLELTQNAALRAEYSSHMGRGGNQTSPRPGQSAPGLRLCGSGAHAGTPRRRKHSPAKF